MSSETAIQSTPTPDVISADITPPPVKRKVGAGILMQAVNLAASLKVTVTLFALSIFLVFAGTWAQKDNGVWTVVDDYFRSAIVWIPFQIFLPRTMKFPGGIYYPGGWLLGGLLLINLLAAHVGLTIKLIRTTTSGPEWLLILLNRSHIPPRMSVVLGHLFEWFLQMLKRSGILILHFGVVVMMVGELVTGKYAAEGSMTIPDGKASNYLESQRKSELAIVDSSDSQTDDVVVVPAKRLRRGRSIQDANLPFDIQVHESWPNSALLKEVPKGKPNPATKGDGLATMAVEKPEVSGTDPEQKVDLPAAYVTLKKKDSGESLGTFLLTPWFSLYERPPQKVTVDGKTYDLEMRFQRTYKPYTIYLKKFTHDVYPGTDKPKDFSSEVRLVDPSEGEELEAKIWMNHPLRYNGETFYQQGFLPGDTGTILQVVRNPGWLLPYISCGLVALGMIVHFGIKLVLFLLRMLGTQKSVGPLLRWGTRLGVMVGGGLIVLLLAFDALPHNPKSGRMDLDEFGRLPVLEGGRVKPIDTLARNNLMVITSRQTWRDEQGRSQPATKWLLDVMTGNPVFNNPASTREKVFRIDNDQVLSLLGLPRREGFRYSIDEFGDPKKMNELIRRAHEAQDREAKTEFDRNVLEFAKHVQLYVDLSELKTVKIIPPASPEEKDWKSLVQALHEEKATGQRDRAAQSLLNVLVAYGKNDAEGFNQSLADYRTAVGDRLPPETRTAGFEAFFNRLEPFYLCTLMYALAAILACGSFLLLCLHGRNWAEPVRLTAFWLLLLALGLHTFGLVARMYIQGRPPVTNLYSSAVFIGWGCVILGLILEMIFHLGIGSLVAAVLGFATSIIAHQLAAGGDTLEMMQAVLDTNFWLATHVTCVTLGYTATFVAWGLAVVFIGLGAGTRLMDSDLMKILSWMIYGVLCFATLLSFVGTVLGGIWADQSWGRFWGWDPKENGALMIVLWNVLVLHARWAGLVKQRGVAVLAVFGGIVTSWSWFGVNELGVGLHSYGFMSGAQFCLWLFFFTNLAIMGVGMMPMRMWLSADSMHKRGFLSEA